MSIRIRRPTLASVSSLPAMALLAVPLVMVNACSKSDGEGSAAEPGALPAATGRLELNLSASAGDQRVYRLKNATFTLTAMSNGAAREVRADAERERLSLELAPDRYEVLLQAGYQLELSEGGTVTPVEATLASPNPALVSIAADTVTPLDFMFQVSDGDVETGERGRLDLGIDVIEGDAGSGLDCSDAWEPNDDQPLATPLAIGAELEASVCGRNVDFYRFVAPVPAGELFEVRFQLQSEKFFLVSMIFDSTIVPDEPFEDRVAVSAGQSDYGLALLSNGAEYLLRVSMGFDPFEGDGADPDPPTDEGIGYRVGLAEYVNTATNSCCTTSDTGGCSDDAVNACLCAANAYCCSTSYDELCVREAIFECGAQCATPPADSDCCSESSTPGCAVSEVQACVCAINPYCCFGEFDENCVALAQGRCDAACSP